MALSGLEIFKLLPKTNCGDCGVPTCMAFAMRLAQKTVDLGECPDASEEAKTTLGVASEPPIRLVKIGGANPVELGDETVMFRHEKTFFHPTGIAIQLSTSEDEEKLKKRIRDIAEYEVTRVGEVLRTDLFFITHDSDEKDRFIDTIHLVKEYSTKGIILDCPERDLLSAGLELLKESRPAILLRDELAETDIELALANDASIIISARSLDELTEQSERAKAAGVKNIILNMVSNNIGKQLQYNTILRRSALRQDFKSFGYPILTFMHNGSDYDLVANAALGICKYSSIIVLSKYDKALLYTLFTLRQNIFTDPQNPIQVDPKVYPIGEPSPVSPVLVTTNFSLTYFIVSAEIENSGISAHLVVVDCEGQSVLTAWAAGKFDGPIIAKYIKELNLEQQVKTRKLVIPGYVSQISGELEESLPGWEIIVGCQEASDIPAFIKGVDLT
jgi:acetyl-CoA decarbonylase/synthase complex subunit gamma